MIFIESKRNNANFRDFSIHGIYSDIAFGINFDKRKTFFLLLEDVLEYKVDWVSIVYKNRLLRFGFSFLLRLFQQFRTELIISSEIGNPILDNEDIFEEIITFLCSIVIL